MQDKTRSVAFLYSPPPPTRSDTPAPARPSCVGAAIGAGHQTAHSPSHRRVQHTSHPVCTSNSSHASAGHRHAPHTCSAARGAARSPLRHRCAAARHPMHGAQLAAQHGARSNLSGGQSSPAAEHTPARRTLAAGAPRQSDCARGACRRSAARHGWPRRQPPRRAAGSSWPSR